MEVGKLTVNRRTHTGKGVARKLRARGRLPGVCYGNTLEAPIPIDFDHRDFKSSLDPDKRRNTVITLSVEQAEGAAQSIVVMVKDYQLHPLRQELAHVDFVAVDLEAPVVVDVPVEFHGKAKGTVLGGQLHVVRRRLDVRCKPVDIPASVRVDITELDTNGVIHVSDLQLSEGLEAAVPGHLTIITCSAAPAAEEGEEGEEGEAAAAAS